MDRAGVTLGASGKVCPHAPLWRNSGFHPHRFRYSLRFAGHRFGNKLAYWRRDTPIGTSHGYRRARPHRLSSMDAIRSNAPEVRRGECAERVNTGPLGNVYRESALPCFHKSSKTLILTDTIINIELDKLTEPWRTATKLTGMHHPNGQVFFGMRLPLLLQRRKVKAALRKIHSWQPQRILLSHGRCFDAHADEVIRRIFGLRVAAFGSRADITPSSGDVRFNPPKADIARRHGHCPFSANCRRQDGGPRRLDRCFTPNTGMSAPSSCLSELRAW
jgi:hypothetical protein